MVKNMILGAILLLALSVHLPTPIAADLSECCGTSGPGGKSGQGNDLIRVPLHRAGNRELVVGQTRQVPTTVVGSMAELGRFLGSFGPSPDLDSMKASDAQYFTLTPADFLLDRTFNESQPLERWGGGDNGNLFTDFKEDNEDYFTTSVTSYVGDKGWFAFDPVESNMPKGPAPSVMFFSSASTVFKQATVLTKNFFYIGLPEIITFGLDTCALYHNLMHGSGVTSKNITADSVCPQKNIKAGEYKFSILGLLSGTLINSNDTQAVEDKKRDRKDYINVREYKRLHYRQILNVEEMGNFQIKLFDNTSKTTQLLASRASPMANKPVDISGLELKVYGGGGNRSAGSIPNGSLPYFDIKITPSYVSGTFTRDISKRECQLSTDGKTIYKDGTDHEDKHGNCYNDLRKQPGAFSGPNMIPREERLIKVTLRPAQCLDRQQWNSSWNCPGCRQDDMSRFIFGENQQCVSGAGECSLPRETDPRVKDCPNWLTIAAGDNCCNGESDSYAVGRRLQCEPGSCFFIDYIIDLEDEATGERTVFGDPANHPNGVGEGTWFAYDPEITYEGPRGGGRNFFGGLDPLMSIIILVAGGCILVIGLFSLYHYISKVDKNKHVELDEENPMPKPGTELAVRT